MSSLDGFLDLENELSEILSAVENIDEILEEGADLFVKDLLKLPKPKSKIRKSGYTHLIETFSFRTSSRKSNEVEVGWGKYYGRMVEEGTRKSKRQPHIKPTFERNSKRYYDHMLKKAKLK